MKKSRFSDSQLLPTPLRDYLRGDDNYPESVGLAGVNMSGYPKQSRLMCSAHSRCLPHQQ